MNFNPFKGMHKELEFKSEGPTSVSVEFLLFRHILSQGYEPTIKTSVSITHETLLEPDSPELNAAIDDLFNHAKLSLKKYVIKLKENLK